MTPFICPPRLRGIRILLLDGEPELLDFLAKVLQQHCSADVRASRTTENASALLHLWKPGIVVCDIAINNAQGNPFIVSVRALDQQRGTRIPVVALAASLSVDDRLELSQQGYDAVVPKPVKEEEFLEALATLNLT